MFKYVTLTGLNHYYGKVPFKIGRIIRLQKDYDNNHDSEAIKVVLPFIGTVGYVANSLHTVFDGTNSAGRIYDKFGDHVYAKVEIVSHSSIVAELIPPTENINFDNAFNLFCESEIDETQNTYLNVNYKF